MGINKIAAYPPKCTIMEAFEEEHGKVDIEKNLVKTWTECNNKNDLQLEVSLADLAGIFALNSVSFSCSEKPDTSQDSVASQTFTEEKTVNAFELLMTSANRRGFPDRKTSR